MLLNQGTIPSTAEVVKGGNISANALFQTTNPPI